MFVFTVIACISFCIVLVIASISYLGFIKRIHQKSPMSKYNYDYSKKQRLAKKYKMFLGVSNSGFSLDGKEIFVLTSEELGM